MEQRYRKTEDKKPWPGLELYQDFAKWKGLKLIVKKRKCLNCETRRVNLCNSNVSKTGGNGGPGAKPSAARQLFVMFWKKSYFNAIG